MRLTTRELKLATAPLALWPQAEILTQSAIRETCIFLTAERNNSPTDHLASIGGLFQLEARLKCLRMLRKQVIREFRQPTKPR